MSASVVIILLSPSAGRSNAKTRHSPTLIREIFIPVMKKCIRKLFQFESLLLSFLLSTLLTKIKWRNHNGPPLIYVYAVQPFIYSETPMYSPFEGNQIIYSFTLSATKWSKTVSPKIIPCSKHRPLRRMRRHNVINNTQCWSGIETIQNFSIILFIPWIWLCGAAEKNQIDGEHLQINVSFVPCLVSVFNPSSTKSFIWRS